MLSYPSKVRSISQRQEPDRRQLLGYTIYSLDVDIKLPVGRQALVDTQGGRLRRARGFCLAIRKARGLIHAKAARLVGVLPKDGQQELILQLPKNAPHPGAPDL